MILYDSTVRTIAHLSDIHFDAVDTAVADALVRDLVDRKPDLLVLSGDLTMRARVGQFRAAAAYLVRLPKPQIVLAGNHDVPLFNVIRRWVAPLGRFQRLVTSEMLPVYRDDELLVIGLNTASRGSRRLSGFWKDGRVDESQLEAAAKLLRSAPAGVAKIIVTHHPFASPDKEHEGDTVGNGPAVLHVLHDAGVEMLLAGHLHHAYHVTMPQGTISLQAGSACSTRRRGRANSYNWIAIDGTSIAVEVRDFDGAGFATVKRKRFPRGIGAARQAPPSL